MKAYSLNCFTHEPIGPQTSNDLGPINGPKLFKFLIIGPKNLEEIFLQQLFFSTFILKTKISKYQQKKIIYSSSLIFKILCFKISSLIFFCWYLLILILAKYENTMDVMAHHKYVYSILQQWWHIINLYNFAHLKLMIKFDLLIFFLKNHLHARMSKHVKMIHTHSFCLMYG